MDAEPGDLRSLPWPLFTIDFEASSLEPGSFPIEVGICRWVSPDDVIEGWSTLIKPVARWAEQGTWSASSEEVHGIRRDELEHGMSPADTVGALNQIIGNHAAFCDGGQFDFAWARQLVVAAGIMNTFKLGDFDMLGGACDGFGYARLVRWLDRAPPRHRARDDAERLMKALAHGLGLKQGSSGTISFVSPDRQEDSWGPRG